MKNCLSKQTKVNPNFIPHEIPNLPQNTGLKESFPCPLWQLIGSSHDQPVIPEQILVLVFKRFLSRLGLLKPDKNIWEANAQGRDLIVDIEMNLKGRACIIELYLMES